MNRFLLASAAVMLAAAPVLAQDITEIDTPASQLEKVLAEQAEIAGGVYEVRVIEATIDPKTAGVWHVHPTPVYLYITEGEVTMEVEGKEPRVFKAGEALAEPLDVDMRGVNTSDQPVKLVVFQISPAEKAFLEEEKKD